MQGRRISEYIKNRAERQPKTVAFLLFFLHLLLVTLLFFVTVAFILLSSSLLHVYLSLYFHL